MILLCPHLWPFLAGFGLLAWYFPWWTWGFYFALTWSLGFYFAFTNRDMGWFERWENGKLVQSGPSCRIPFWEAFKEGFMTPFIVPVLLITGVPII